MQKREIGFYAWVVVFVVLVLGLLWASTTNQKGYTGHEPRPSYPVVSK